jgi:hypothetical protein
MSYKVNIFTGKLDKVGKKTQTSGDTVGRISEFSSVAAVPANYLILTGTLTTKQEVSKILYADLYVIIGDVYGVSLDSDNFVLPPIVGLTPKGGTAANYSQSGGSDTLTINQLPVVDATGTIQVSTNPPNIDVADDSFFANTDSFIANGSQGTTVSVAGVNVNFGANQPHEHPYQNFIFAICFAAQGITGSVVNNITTTSPIENFGTSLNPNIGITPNPEGDYVLTFDSLGNASFQPNIRLKGITNYVTLKANAATTTYDFVFPTNGGTNGYVLTSNGSGETTWTDPLDNTVNEWIAPPTAENTPCLQGQKAFNDNFVYFCSLDNFWVVTPRVLNAFG